MRHRCPYRCITPSQCPYCMDSENDEPEQTEAERLDDEAAAAEDRAIARAERAEAEIDARFPFPRGGTL